MDYRGRCGCYDWSDDVLCLKLLRRKRFRDRVFLGRRGIWNEGKAVIGNGVAGHRDVGGRSSETHFAMYCYCRSGIDLEVLVVVVVRATD